MSKFLLPLATVFLFSGASIAQPAEDHPNIVIILADDFGVGDIQSHFPDNKIATPHLDRLVRQGMSITDAHSPSAVCSPTRYGLLAGRYAWRTRLQEWVIAAYEPPLIAKEYCSVLQEKNKNISHIPHANIVRVVENPEGVLIGGIFRQKMSYPIVVKIGHIVEYVPG